jgi:hypothetical protein
MAPNLTKCFSNPKSRATSDHDSPNARAIQSSPNQLNPRNKNLRWMIQVESAIKRLKCQPETVTNVRSWDIR